MPVTSTWPDAVTTRWTVISLRVRVPVLSEAITEAEPSVSTEDRSLTMALRLAIRWVPSDSTTVRMAGNPPGRRPRPARRPGSGWQSGWPPNDPSRSGS